MPERDTETGHSSRLLRGLIWAGVLLAPLAAAIVLLGQSSSSVRFAVLLIAVSVALIGASVLIRSDPVLQRMHVEDRVAEEVQALRRELRAELGRGASGGTPSENSGFFRDAPMAPPDGDPFPAAPRRMPDPGFAGGGRAAVPAVAASAGIPVPRVAASVPGPASPAAPRASAAVRPGGTQYGRFDSPDSDFGESNGSAAVRAAGIYGSARVAGPGPDGYGAVGDGHGAADGFGRPASDGYAQRDGAPTGRATPIGYGPSDDYDPASGYGSANGYDSGGDYGSANGYDSGGDYGSANGYDYGNGYHSASDYEPANGYDPPNDYGPVNGYGHRDDGYGDYSHADPDVAGCGPDGGYDGPQSSGDPNYKARRHRPSANDTNVGTLADFASYPGWSEEPEPDERYVQGYGPRRR